MAHPNQKAKLDLPELENGPLQHRQCRDILCFLLFIVNVGAMLYCTIYAYTKGNPDNIYRGTDINKNICGEGASSNYPYLYFTYPTSLSTENRVCVSQCPKYESGSLSSLSCYPNTKVSTCSYDYIISEDGKTRNTAVGSNLNIFGYDSYPLIGRVCFPSSASMGYFDNNTTNNVSSSLTTIISGGYLSNLINDIKNNWQILLTGLAISFIISLLVIYIMRWLTGCIVWLLLIATFIFIVVLGFMLAYSGNLFSTSQVKFFGVTIPKINGNNTYYVYYGIACWVGAVLYLIVLLCCCCRIRLAVAICKCAGAFLTDVCSVVLVPIIMSIAVICLWVICITCMVWLVSAAPFVADGSVFTSLKSFSDTSLIRFYYFIFGTLWCNAFIQASSTFIIASTCCMWYYSQGPGGHLHFPVMRSLGRLLRYHIGSIALGSILVAIVQFLEFILELIKNQIQKTTNADSNCCFRCLCGCARCCLACLQRIVKFINKNAYILIAFKGENFCSSAKQAFQIIWSNPARFGVLVGIGSLIMFIGKLAISCGTTAVIYAIITYSGWGKIMSPLLFLLLVFIYSYAVATVFMELYEQATDALLICFIVDETTQKNKAHLSRALYAPPELQDIMEHYS